MAKTTKKTTQKATRKKPTAKTTKARTKSKTTTQKKPAKKAARRASPNKKSSTLKKVATKEIKSLNFKAVEKEVNKLSGLLKNLQNRNRLVKNSIAYLEKEQKRAAKQLQEFKNTFIAFKERSLEVLSNIPNNAEGLYNQLKGELVSVLKKLKAK